MPITFPKLPISNATNAPLPVGPVKPGPTLPLSNATNNPALQTPTEGRNVPLYQKNLALLQRLLTRRYLP